MDDDAPTLARRTKAGLLGVGTSAGWLRGLSGLRAERRVGLGMDLAGEEFPEAEEGHPEPPHGGGAESGDSIVAARGSTDGGRLRDAPPPDPPPLNPEAEAVTTSVDGWTGWGLPSSRAIRMMTSS